MPFPRVGPRGGYNEVCGSVGPRIVPDPRGGKMAPGPFSRGAPRPPRAARGRASPRRPRQGAGRGGAGRGGGAEAAAAAAGYTGGAAAGSGGRGGNGGPAARSGSRPAAGGAGRGAARSVAVRPARRGKLAAGARLWCPAGGCKSARAPRCSAPPVRPQTKARPGRPRSGAVAWSREWEALNCARDSDGAERGEEHLCAARVRLRYRRSPALRARRLISVGRHLICSKSGSVSAAFAAKVSGAPREHPEVRAVPPAARCHLSPGSQGAGAGVRCRCAASRSGLRVCGGVALVRAAVRFGLWLRCASARLRKVPAEREVHEATWGKRV